MGLRLSLGLTGGGQVREGWRATLAAVRAQLALSAGADNPHSLAAMASPPTITAAATTPSGLTQAYRYTVNDTTARYAAGGNKANATFRRFPTATIASTGGNVSGGEQAIHWRTSWVCSGARVAVRVLGSSSPYRFLVNGQYVDTTGTLTATNSGTQYIELNFGSAATRTITLEGEQAQGVDGLHYAPGDTVTQPAADPFRILMLGDSFTEGTGSTRNGDGIAAVLGDYLGTKDSWGSGVGGTGYIATSSGTKYTLAQRLVADLGRFAGLGAVDLIVVAMGFNDKGQTPAAVQAAAAACFETIRARCPTAVVIVLTPWDNEAPTAPSQNYVDVKTGLVAAVGTRPGFYLIDVQGVSYTKVDANHPDTAGHKTLATDVATKIRTALA